MTNSSRHSSVKSQNPVFVPSPRWLSESPAYRQTSGHPDDYRGPGGTSISDHSRIPSFAPNLKSPIPPPPANLYPGSPAAFNVDPGIPFLATIGPTEDGSSSDGSVKDEESPRRGFGGGLMSGIKNVVRRSLRDRTRSQQPPVQAIYTQPPQFRDSGYAESDPTPPPSQPHPMLEPPQMPEMPHVSSPPSSRRTVHSVRPPSETLLGHLDDGDEATMIGHQNGVSMGKQKRKPSYHDPRPDRQHSAQSSSPEMPPREEPRVYPDIVAPEAIASPISAELEYAPHYLQMSIKTPPPSEISLNTYLKRFQKFVHDVNQLPWIGKERITEDYYPEKSRRSDEPKHHPAIVWRSEGFTKLGYPSSDPQTPSEYNDSNPSLSPVSPGLRAPRRGSYTAMDLGAEFEGNYPPLPVNPPDPTKRSVRPRAIPPEPTAPPDSMLLQVGPPPSLPPAQSFPIPLAVHVTYENYPPNLPPSGQWTEITVPQFYIPPPSELAATRPPVVVEPSFATPLVPSMPMDPPFFIPPISTNVPSVASPHTAQSFIIPPISTNAPSVASPPVVPLFVIPPPTSQNAPYTPPVEPSPVIPPFSKKIPSASSSASTSSPPTGPRINPMSPPGGPTRVNGDYPPHHQDHDEWEPYPLERPGYVPFDHSEHYYGDQYGTGIHAARPPLVRPPLSSDSS